MEYPLDQGSSRHIGRDTPAWPFVEKFVELLAVPLTPRSWVQADQPMAPSLRHAQASLRALIAAIRPSVLALAANACCPLSVSR